MSIEMLFYGGKKKALTLSYDDGVEQDIRLVEILDKWGIKCTFNVNGGLFAPEGTKYPEGHIHRRMSKSVAYKLYQDSGHEVAIHGYTHPFLERLPKANVMREIIEDRRTLETVFGGVVRGMAYPFGTYSDEVVEVLKETGIVYSRTTISTERFDIPTDWLRMPATCHHGHPRLMALAEEFLAREDLSLFYLWGHSYEFESDDNWQLIEDFAAKVGNRDDVWYATNIEVYDYVMAYRSLLFNIDCTCAQNPTAVDVWISVDGKPVKIPAGKTVLL